MNRLTPTEKMGVALALVFVIAGAHLIRNPTEAIVFHPAGSARGKPHPSGRFERVSEKRSQFYGALSVALGIGIGWLALGRGRH